MAIPSGYQDPSTSYQRAMRAPVILAARLPAAEGRP